MRELFGEEYRSEFVEPTIVYLDDILALDEQIDIHGMMHITGGAYTKLKDLLHNVNIKIKRNHKLKPQPIFKELYKRGISDEEMYKTFNCGIGFVLSVSSRDVGEIISNKLSVDIIGEVNSGNKKIKIESMFSDKEIEF